MKWPRLRGPRPALPIAPAAARGLFVSLAIIGLAAALLIYGYAVFTDSDSATGTATASDTFVSPYAIFGMNDACSSSEGVSWTGSAGSVTGRVHTNSSFTVAGSNNSFNDEVTYVCDASVNNTSHTFADGLTQVTSRAIALPLALADLETSPGGFDPSKCDFIFPSSVTLTGASLTASGPGVYCSDGDIQLSISNTTAEASFFARGRIHVSGTNIDLKSFHPSGVLFFSDDSGGDAITLEIQISGSRSVFGGMQAAPNGMVGRIDLSGAKLTVNGCLIAQIVHISGDKTIVDAKHGDAFACDGIVEGTVSVAVGAVEFFEVDGSGNITTTPCGPIVPGDICRAVGDVTYTGTLDADLEVEGSIEDLSSCFDVSGTIDATTDLFQIADPDFGPEAVMEGDAFAYSVDVELPSAAGNECQGATATVTIDATATSS